MQFRHLELELQLRLELGKRQGQLIPLAIGLFAQIFEGLEVIGGELWLESIGHAFAKAFGEDKSPWVAGDEKCIISFSTHGGGECKARIDAKGQAVSHPTGSWNVCAWADPEHSDPPIQYFSDPGVGDYSVQFTSTDKHVWKGAANTRKCIVEGLCNPRITFYRDRYNIILDTWLSVGDKTQGGYFHDFGGLSCGNGPVKNQFRPNGNEIGFDCGIPCEGSYELPGTNGEPAPELPIYTWSFPS